jgi:Beta galactosidase small chain
MPLLSANALHHTTDDLQSAKHSPELPPRDVTVVNLDLRQQGLGCLVVTVPFAPADGLTAAGIGVPVLI